jgi:hypothetical protein
VAAAYSSDQINLTWTPVARATYYTVKRGIRSAAVGGSKKEIDSQLTHTTYPDTSRLKADTDYFYIVEAVDATGAAPVVIATSNEASATTDSVTINGP